jgi:transposase InsO family protein
MDLYSRRIVGWSYRQTMTEELVIEALSKAIKTRRPGAGLIHHSDRGGQYAGKRYRAMLVRASMSQRMSAAGNCYDNTFMESCFGTIKTELSMKDYALRDCFKSIFSIIGQAFESSDRTSRYHIPTRGFR